MNEHAKHIFDWAAVGATIATIAGWLPAAAALASLVWTLLRIVEMCTGRAIHQWIAKK